MGKISLNKVSFTEIAKNLDKKADFREKVILGSRPVLSLSKQVIHAINNGKKPPIAELKQAYGKLRRLASRSPEQLHSGSFKAAAQEYVEALCYDTALSRRMIPTPNELGVQEEHYLLGVCDLVGELSRAAINSSARGEPKLTFEIKQLVDDIYGELIKLNVPNSELRKKVDSVKYELKKLESAAFELKLRE